MSNSRRGLQGLLYGGVLSFGLACSDSGGSEDDAVGGAAGSGTAGSGGAGATAAAGGSGGGSTGGTPGSGGVAATGGAGGAAVGGAPATGGAGGAPGTGGGGGVPGTGGTGGGTSTLGCTAAWSTGFENGFPGELSSFDNGSWSADGTMPAGRVSAWTIIDRASGEPVYAGDYAYKGWIVAPASESHRAYPGVSYDVQTPAVNTFWVYLDVDYDVLGDEWVHFGTWGNREGNSGQWALHTMSVRRRELEFAHTEPFLGEYIGPMPVPEFPLRRWVRFTVYLHYEGSSGFVQAWQDGVPMLRANVSQLSSHPGTRHTYAHWGMYAGNTASQGVQYNDDIRVWELDAPLSDLTTEPDCYLGP